MRSAGSIPPSAEPGCVIASPTLAELIPAKTWLLDRAKTCVPSVTRAPRVPEPKSWRPADTPIGTGLGNRSVGAARASMIPVVTLSTSTPSSVAGTSASGRSLYTLTTALPALLTPTPIPATPAVSRILSSCLAFAALAFASPGGSPPGGPAALAPRPAAEPATAASNAASTNTIGVLRCTPHPFPTRGPWADVP